MGGACGNATTEPFSSTQPDSTTRCPSPCALTGVIRDGPPSESQTRHTAITVSTAFVYRSPAIRPPRVQARTASKTPPRGGRRGAGMGDRGAGRGDRGAARGWGVWRGGGGAGRGDGGAGSGGGGSGSGDRD